MTSLSKTERRTSRPRLVAGGVPILMIALIFRAAAIAHAAPGPPVADDKSAQVKALIHDLDAERRALRLKAERELLDLGPEILPLLPAPELLTSPAVKNAVARIRAALERRKALESVLPSRVTIQGERPLSKLLEDFSKQTGNGLNHEALDQSLLTRSVAVDFQNVPFWKALDELAARSGFQYQFDAGSAMLNLVARPAGGVRSELAVAYAGPFRLAVETANLGKIFGDTQQQLRLQLNLASEPRLRPLFLKYAAADVAARTAAGKSLPSRNPEARYDLPLAEGGRYLRLSSDFLVPPPADFTLVNVRGKFLIQIAAGSEHIRFTDLPRAAGVARRRGGVTVTLQRVVSKKTAETQDVTLRVNVAYDNGGPAFESHRSWIFHNEVSLEDSDGRHFTPDGGYDTALQGDGVVSLEYRFQKIPGRLNDYNFVYVAPTLIVDLPLEFDFESIRVK